MPEFTNKPYTQTLPDGTSFEMMPVEGGEFMMGSPDGDKDASGDEHPQHKVNLDYNFYMGKFPVTQKLFNSVINAKNPSEFKGDNRPVERVSWYDALAFCNALSEKCGLATCYFSDKKYSIPFEWKDNLYNLLNEGEVFFNSNATGYRLPSEAELEYAAQGGNKSEEYIYAGSDKLREAAQHFENSYNEAKPVGLKLPNELGCNDLSGNVWEWCDDWNDENYYAGYVKRGIVKNPTGPPWERIRLLRGGSWFNSAEVERTFRSWYRYDAPPGIRFDNSVGFRLVLASWSGRENGR